MSEGQKQFVLPPQVTGRVQVNRLFRELEVLEDFLQQAQVREPGVGLKLPAVTRSMEDICQANGLNLLQSDHKEALRKFLVYLKQRAPVIHVSFAVDASPAVIKQIVVWLRGNVDPYALVQIGLSPGIVAGCVVRAQNQVYDFSLKHRFDEKRSILADKIRSL
jgi:F0F1-type ATP synthase delta subunit